jgi:hypothetical protein
MSSAAFLQGNCRNSAKTTPPLLPRGYRGIPSVVRRLNLAFKRATLVLGTFLAIIAFLLLPAVLIRRSPDMPIQIVMGRSGDTRYQFEAADAGSAERRFRELTQRGFTAVALGKDGADNRVVKTFDPNIERTLFIPRLEGG